MAAIAEVQDGMNQINGTTATANVEANAGAAISGLNSVAQKITEVDAMTASPTLNMSSFSGAASIVSNLLSMVNQLNKTVTTTHVTVETKQTAGALGTAHSRGTATALSPAHAEGTTSDGRLKSNQTALTSEEG